jgi:hypothetical protein
MGYWVFQKKVEISRPAQCFSVSQGAFRPIELVRLSETARETILNSEVYPKFELF